MLVELCERCVKKGIYVLSASSEEMGHIRTPGTETVRGKPHTWHFKNGYMWLIPKDAEKPADGRKNFLRFFVRFFVLRSHIGERRDEQNSEPGFAYP